MMENKEPSGGRGTSVPEILKIPIVGVLRQGPHTLIQGSAGSGLRGAGDGKWAMGDPV